MPVLLALLDPLLRYQLALTHKEALIESLLEVQMQDGDASFLAPEYREILEHANVIRTELKESPGRLQFLHGIVTDLFVDKYKFRGMNVAARVPSLLRLLQNNYSLPAVLEFFERGG